MLTHFIREWRQRRPLVPMINMLLRPYRPSGKGAIRPVLAEPTAAACNPAVPVLAVAVAPPACTPTVLRDVCVAASTLLSFSRTSASPFLRPHSEMRWYSIDNGFGGKPALNDCRSGCTPQNCATMLRNSSMVASLGMSAAVFPMSFDAGHVKEPQLLHGIEARSAA
jgi:hypothetical protein